VKIRPSELLVFLHPDPTHPALERFEVRRALLMALDRERMLKTIFGETAQAARVSHVPIPGPLPEGAAVVPHDPKAAREALEKAGVAGTTITLFHGPTPVDRATAAEIVKDAAIAGLTLEAREVPTTIDVYRKRKHGGLLLNSTTGERDSAPEKYWGVLQVEGKYNRAFRNNAYDNAIATLVEREERALYPERREQIRDLLFTAYSQKLPSLPLFFLADRFVTVPDLKGWEEGSGANFGTTIERWHFAPSPAPAK
jgi:ABC-type transport system substrate-binding protein